MFGAFDLRHKHRDALGRRRDERRQKLRGNAHSLTSVARDRQRAFEAGGAIAASVSIRTSRDAPACTSAAKSSKACGKSSPTARPNGAPWLRRGSFDKLKANGHRRRSYFFSFFQLLSWCRKQDSNL
jgi:hypothetical protein